MNGKSRAGKMALLIAALGLGLATGAKAGNAVGYIKAQVPSGLSLMSVPFEQVGGGAFSVEGVFGDSLADGSELLIYTPGSGYDTVLTYYEGIGWYNGEDEAGAFKLERGVGFWVRNSSLQAVTLILRGQVPTSNKNVSVPAGLVLVSFGFPASQSIQEVAGLAAADGDEIVVRENGNYVAHTYYEGLGWYLGENLSDLNLQPGRAFWYRRAGSTTTWTQTKPFSLD